MNLFMKRAVDLAIANIREGGQPFGAVLVKDDQIIAEGVNELHISFDISGHAELLAIRNAQKQLRTNDLSGTTMYASGEPCPMCLAAMYFAGMKEIFYCLSVEDAAKVGLEASKEIYEDLQKPKELRQLSITQIPWNKGEENPFQRWQREQSL